MMDKKTMRRAAIARRKAMAPQEVAEHSAKISIAILELPEFNAAGQLFTYWAINNEVDPGAALLCAEQNGKALYAPRVFGNEMQWGIVSVVGRSRRDSMQTGYFGNREPLPDAPTPSRMLPNDLCLVPGVLFRSDGHRLGQGGGHFDRFLAGFSGISIGLAYDWQLEDTFPVEAHDVAVNLIVTESRVLVPGRSRE